MRFLLLLSFLLPLAASAKKQTEYLDQHYGSHERQIFDLWLPKKKLKKSPLVIYIHGGGFSIGSKDEMRGHKLLIEKYNKEGIALASINYRYLTHAPLQTIMREDIAGFVQFIRYHADEYNINKNLILPYGISAGASSSLWLATHDDIADKNSPDPIKRESSRVTAAGHLNGQVSYDYMRWYDFYGKELTDKYIGKQVWSRYHLNSFEDIFTEEGKKIRADLDMYGNMTADDSPLILINNMDDHPDMDGDHFIHSPHHTRHLAQKAESLGIKTEVLINADGSFSMDAHRAVYRFFTNTLNQ